MPKRKKVKGMAVKSGDVVDNSGKMAVAKPAEKPISLAPLKFEDAITGLLRVGRVAGEKVDSNG